MSKAPTIWHRGDEHEDTGKRETHAGLVWIVLRRLSDGREALVKPEAQLAADVEAKRAAYQAEQDAFARLHRLKSP